MITVKIKKLHDAAIIPTMGSAHAAAFDLYACDGGQIMPLTRRTVGTGICWEPVWNVTDYLQAKGITGRPLYTPWLKIEGRSGLAQRQGIDILGGVIDEDYRGEIKVLMYNTSEHAYEVKAGDRIAQAVLHLRPRFEIEVVDELGETERGSGGFGSTG